MRWEHRTFLTTLLALALCAMPQFGASAASPYTASQLLSLQEDMALQCIGPANGDVANALDTVAGTYTMTWLGCYSLNQFAAAVTPNDGSSSGLTPSPSASGRCPSRADATASTLAQLNRMAIDTSAWALRHNYPLTNVTVKLQCELICAVNFTGRNDDASVAHFGFAMWEGNCLCMPAGTTALLPGALDAACCVSTAEQSAGGVNGSAALYVMNAVSSCYSSSSSSSSSTTTASSTSAPVCDTERCATRTVANSTAALAPVRCCGASLSTSTTTVASFPYYYLLLFTPFLGGAYLWAKLKRFANRDRNNAAEEAPATPMRPLLLAGGIIEATSLGTILQVTDPITGEPTTAAVSIPTLRDDDESAALAAVLMLNVRRQPSRIVHLLQQTASGMRKPSSTAATAETSSATADDGTHTCSVCLSPFPSDGVISVLKCEHAFHTDCLREYIKHQFRRYREPTCPVCKQDLLVDSMSTNATAAAAAATPAAAAGSRGLLSLPLLDSRRQ